MRYQTLNRQIQPYLKVIPITYSIVLNRRYTFVCGENKYIFQKVLTKIQLKKTILSLTAFANERIKLEMFLWRMLACAADRLASVHWDVIVGHTLAAFLFTRKEDGPIRRNDFKVCLVLFVPKIFQIICVRAKFDKIYACLVLIPTNLWGRGWKLASFIYCMEFAWIGIYIPVFAKAWRLRSD